MQHSRHDVCFLQETTCAYTCTISTVVCVVSHTLCARVRCVPHTNITEDHAQLNVCVCTTAPSYVLPSQRFCDEALPKPVLTHNYSYTCCSIVLIGHSKGGLDALAAVAKYKGELAPIVRGIVCLQSPIGGSPVASDLVFGSSAVKMFVSALYRLVGSDFESLRDLTYESRQKVGMPCPLSCCGASPYLRT